MPVRHRRCTQIKTADFRRWKNQKSKIKNQKTRKLPRVTLGSLVTHLAVKPPSGKILI